MTLRRKPIRHLDQDAGAVAGIRLAAAGAAMQQVDEDLQAARDDAVRPSAGDVDHEPDAARVVLEGTDRRVRSAAEGLQMLVQALRELSQAAPQKENRMITSDP